MITVYRTTDRIPIEIGELKVWVSPLSIENKMKIASLVRVRNGKEEPDAMAIAVHTIKYAVKDLTGVEDIDHNKYELSFEPDGSLSMDSVSDVLNMTGNDKLIAACVAVAANQQMNFELDGVRVLAAESKKKSTSSASQ